MSEEIKNEVPAQEPTATADSEVKTEATAEVTKPIEESTEELVNPLTGEAKEIAIMNGNLLLTLAPHEVLILK